MSNRRDTRPKSPPSQRQLDALAAKISKEIIDATKNGSVDYVAAVLSSEVSLADLFDKTFSPTVRNRVYRLLELDEQSRG